jgi:hypothetical protein
MSACRCEERSKPLHERRWVVTARECNYSAFSGYHWTPSDYSALRCGRCGASWRTKAKYVDQLLDGDVVWIQDTDDDGHWEVQHER